MPTMKTKTTTALLFALLASPLSFAAGDYKHDHKAGHKHDDHSNLVKGPNDGHVVKSGAGFSFEVTVDKERKARIVILDKDLKPAALGHQEITGIAGPRSAPVKLTFAKGKDADADVLISDNALPAGAHIPVILSIKPTPDAKAVVERFELHLH